MFTENNFNQQTPIPENPLKKQKWENFAQDVAVGKPPFKAYGQHCYNGKHTSPSRSLLQSGASQLMQNPIVRARVDYLQLQNAKSMRMSADEIIRRIEDLALNAEKEKVRLDALIKLYEIGGYNKDKKVNVKYELVAKIDARSASNAPQSGAQGGDAIPI
jgi:sporulation protein YlmC with PRC-barrel domain